MSIAGIRKDEWVVMTYCDFREASRKESIRTHFSVDAATRSFKKLSKIYSRYGRCWQETREGEIINDSNNNR